jgi:hypothetical protein
MEKSSTESASINSYRQWALGAGVFRKREFMIGQRPEPPSRRDECFVFRN